MALAHENLFLTYRDGSRKRRTYELLSAGYTAQQGHMTLPGPMLCVPLHTYCADILCSEHQQQASGPRPHRSPLPVVPVMTQAGFPVSMPVVRIGEGKELFVAWSVQPASFIFEHTKDTHAGNQVSPVVMLLSSTPIPKAVLEE